MEPHLQGIEIEPPGCRDHDLAIDHAAVGEALEKDGVELGKISIERPQIPALNEDVAAAPEHDGAEAVPLRLVEEITRRHIGHELGEHRLDGRIDGERHTQ